MIRLENISKKIKLNTGKIIDLIDNINLEISLKESISIMGKSGTGKTTLLKILAGLNLDYEGEYFFNDELVPKKEAPASEFRKMNIGYITQKFHLLDGRTVRDNVILGNQKVSRKELDEVLIKLSINDLANKKVKELSGGECQRVVIARALIKNPSIILADEPTGSLDEETGKDVLSIFSTLMKQGTQFIIVTHDKNVAKICNKIYILEEKKLVEEPL